MDHMAQELKKMFLEANEYFLADDIKLFKNNISERTLCGALMIKLRETMKNETYKAYKDYHVDVEYNRNIGNQKNIKKCCVVGKNGQYKYKSITCDLIVHSRGENVKQDNLIAIEMKKSTQPQDKKDNDRRRLIALTKDSYDDIWSFDGKTLPEYVCRYKLGIYYEINFSQKNILLEYYYNGNLDKFDQICLLI